VLIGIEKFTVSGNQPANGSAVDYFHRRSTVAKHLAATQLWRCAVTGSYLQPFPNNIAPGNTKVLKMSAGHEFMKNSNRLKGSQIFTLKIKTMRRTELQDVTEQIRATVNESNCQNGLCCLYVPHTTAGVLMNEGYDPAVAREIEAAFDRLVPKVAYSKHEEGNSDSHIKTALTSSSQTLWIDNGKLLLGRWQVIFFAEFDGPRNRELRVKIVSDA
jgi:secondary thiamine-phosphate synthase enzyme